MRIAYITAGAANMYCGSCIHDNTLAAALIRLGHEVAFIPTYTPLRTDETNVAMPQVFYNGISVYLEQKFAFFRNNASVLDNLFNSNTLLKWLSRISVSTNAKDLGALTVSVLAGEEGYQKKELVRLVDWLRDSYQPELVQLTNSMFVGMAREIKRVLRVPVLCALQGEDLFIEGLIEPYQSQALHLLRERAQDVDGFIATSEYYADFMSEYLRIPRTKIHVVKLCLNLTGHGKLLRENDASRPFTIGYMARISPEKGFHLLAKAFQLLAEKYGVEAMRLRVAGYLAKKDRPYFERLHRQLAAPHQQVEYLGEVDRQQKIDLLRSLDVLSVPAVYRESKGLYALEALANGVPVVLPRHGSFPEIISATGGGVLVDPHSETALAEGLNQLYIDSALRARLGAQGHAAVHRDFGDVAMAEATVAVYRQYLARRPQHDVVTQEPEFV